MHGWQAFALDVFASFRAIEEMSHLGGAHQKAVPIV